MKRLKLLVSFACFSLLANAQRNGEVSDLKSGEALAGASITIYSNGNISGLVANKEGKFFVSRKSFDSIRISMIGYHSKTIFSTSQPGNEYLKIQLEPAPADLGEVVVKRS